SSSSESESLPHDGLSLLSSPAPPVVVPFKCIVGYSLQLEDRKRGHKPPWKPAKSPATTKMYIDKNQTHNKNLIAKTNIRLKAAAAKSGTSHQAVNNDNSEEDDSDNEGSIIGDIDFFRDQIIQRYGVDCCYDRIFLSFLHPSDITKYIPLSAEMVRIWANALRNGFISYRSFTSPNLNNEYLMAMEIPLGLVIRLRDGVSSFYNHLNQNVV
ncbi:hypothetical protein PSTT_15219, partial [Puccinia striiformis]